MGSNPTPRMKAYIRLKLLDIVATWVLTGSSENWERGLTASIWGVTNKLKTRWEAVSRGDVLLFYCTAPVRGIIGYGKVKNKYKQDTPFWGEEIEQNRVIWPYRIEFEVDYVLPRPDWEEKAVKAKLGKITIAGISSVADQSLVQQLWGEMSNKWKTTEKVGEKPASEHEDVKKLVAELGRLSNYIVDVEYRMPDISERLDVIWRRVAASVPTFVFEVQIGGSVHQALTKLKHAYDIWNSNIYLVVKEDNYEQVMKYLAGAFHEIKSVIRVITVTQVKKLHEIQSLDYKLKAEVGLR
uniref:EVE domain-containing protein n=1 Tax=Caldiarchaeum subterraneum TaxID=311458 RepID=E6NA58_CALS0|nr:hypothetical protein HGMM_F32B02C09 [Candidatus Caldarchaeum subterraneum]